MPTRANPANVPDPAGGRSLLAGYGALCGLSWTLYAMAGTEWQRGAWRLWDGVYDATWTLGPPMLLGLAALPWVRWLQAGRRGAVATAAWHVLGAALFIGAWLALEFALAQALFGAEHARATLEQRVLWRAVVGAFIYGALVAGFGGALHGRRARAAVLAAAQAEAALVRAELAAISGKLNPHFLFNTLNSLLMLTRRDPGAAEEALLRFSNMMRHVLDTTRGAGDRVPLRDEIAFVRDYLALESLRLGPRLRVDWRVDERTLDDAVPPLTLQPLVENAIAHGLAPRVEGGLLQIHAERSAGPGGGLRLRVQDDGQGCAWPPAKEAPEAAAETAPSRGRGVGLSALRRRFEIDYGGRARLQVRSAPGQGFEVEIFIPQELHADGAYA